MNGNNPLLETQGDGPIDLCTRTVQVEKQRQHRIEAIGDDTSKKIAQVSSQEQIVSPPNANNRSLKSPSSTLSSPRMIAGLHLSLDIDSTDDESFNNTTNNHNHINNNLHDNPIYNDDDDDADTMEMTTCSNIEDDLIVASQAQGTIVFDSGEQALEQPQSSTTKLSTHENRPEVVVDLDSKPPARQSYPKHPIKQSHGYGTSSDPICLDDNVPDTPTEKNDKSISVGCPVYSPFPGKNPLHEEFSWGLVSSKTHGSDGKYRYCIDFDNGKKIGPPGIPSDYLHRMEDQVRLEIDGKVGRTNIPKQYLDLWDSSHGASLCQDWYKTSKYISSSSTKKPHPEPALTSGLTYQELLRRACGTCHQCKSRPICGSCVGCYHNKNTSFPGTPLHICVQKMCSKIPLKEKRQHCPSILPAMWYFGFDNETSNKKHGGLWIVREDLAKKFMSFESAKHHTPLQFNHLKAENFYRHVGLLANDSKENDIASPKIATVSSSSKAPTCRSPTQHIQPPHNDTKFPWSLEEIHAKRCLQCQNCKREPCRLCHTCRNNSSVGCLRRMCDKIDDIHKCQTSKYLPKGWSFCFSSMVQPGDAMARLDGLKLVAPNENVFSSVESAMRTYPLAFAFYQNAPKKFYNFAGIEMKEEDFNTLKRNATSSPPRKRQRLGDQISVPSIIEIDCSASEQSNDPPSPRNAQTTHPLENKSFYKEWLREDGTKMFVTGRIKKVIDSTEETGEMFIVEFDDDCRALINESNRGMSCVPPTMKFGRDEAWDGCLRSFEIIGSRPKSLLAQAPNCYERWKTPHTYWRKMVPVDGKLVRGYHILPCVEMSYTGFLLKFSVKESSLQTSPFGVFLSIKPLFQSEGLPDKFSLPAGHLLDFGVVAPYRVQDVRSNSAHFIKSIIHLYKNEENCFVNKDEKSHLDITDDMTGCLHLTAKRHIPPFVNKIRDNERETVSVCARFDPEGALHYLLGHPSSSQGDFTFPADGTEREIYVAYQDCHPNSPNRGGLAVNDTTKSGLQDIVATKESQYMDALEIFDSDAVEEFVKTFKPIISRDPPPTRLVLLRAIAMAILFKHQLEKYLESAEVQVEKTIDPLLKECKEITFIGFHAWESHFSESPVDLHREAIASNLFRSVFKKVNSRGSIDSLTPNEFRHWICPRIDPGLSDK